VRFGSLESWYGSRFGEALVRKFQVACQSSMHWARCYIVTSRRPKLCCFCSCWEQILIILMSCFDQYYRSDRGIGTKLLACLLDEGTRAWKYAKW
jgi:hypothetical protein